MMKLTVSDIYELQKRVASNRDEPSYKQLFLYFHKPLSELALSYVRSRELAEEVVCDVLMKVWTMQEDLLQVKQLRLYLYRAVRNTCINELKKSNRFQPWDAEEADLGQASYPSNPEEILMKDEFRKKLLTTIRQLPPQCQLVYKLIREDGCTYKEVSQLLAISVNTVDRHLNKALHKLLHTAREYFYFYFPLILDNFPEMPLFFGC